MLIVGGLAVVLVVVVATRLLGPKAEPSETASAATASGIPGGGSPSGLDADPKHLATIAKMAGSRSGDEYTGGDARDPMVALAGRRTPASERGDGAPAVVTPTTLPAMSLYGIVWDPASPVALVDGQELRVGDTIKGARVIDIGVDRVVFTYRSRQFVLTVE